MQTFLAALLFYTALPLPIRQPLTFEGIARWLPVVGLLVGGLLAIAHWSLSWIVPEGVRAALLLALWVGVTAGLHLDGVMDTADGLAAGPPRDRRLAAMADSRAGAFGVMAAILLLLLKFAVLLDLSPQRWWVLLLVPAWGRWGQLLAIALYPYLKQTGKGRFLKDSTRLAHTVWPALPVLVLAAVGVGTVVGDPQTSILWSIGSGIVAWAVGYWFYRQLGGHTGDTYGAVVEWAETFCLLLATVHLP